MQIYFPKHVIKRLGHNLGCYKYVVLKNRYGPSRNDMIYISQTNEGISNDIIYSYICMFI